MKTSRTKRYLTALMAFVIAITSLVVPVNTALAAESQLFTGNGFAANFMVGSSWHNGYSGSLTIINTGQYPIEDWILTVTATATVLSFAIYKTPKQA